MTKTEALKQLKELSDKLSDLQWSIDILKDEAQETYDSIEPYEGKMDLTPQQEERQEWFDNMVYNLEQAYDSIQEALDLMDEIE